MATATARKTGKFKIRSGLHEYGGRLYKPGDVIEYHRDLARRWPEKFVRVDDRTKVSPGQPVNKPTDEELESIRDEFEADLETDDVITSPIEQPKDSKTATGKK